MSIEIDPARHRELIAAMSRAVTAISAELDALERTTSDLRPRWSGTAQRAYDRAHDQWRRSMSEMRNALEAAAASATEAAEILTRANRDAAAVWR